MSIRLVSRSFGFKLALFASFLCLSASSVSAGGFDPIGQRVEDFTLDNCYGKPVTLSEVAKGKVTALVFLGTECPLARLYGPRLSELQSQFESKGVVFIGINSNKQDSMTELAAYANRYGINFPLLKDVGNVVADQVHAVRTPEVFLLDRDGVIQYHGRIDDQYGVGYSRDKTIDTSLANAIGELVDGKSVAEPRTDVVGCFIGRVKKLEPTGEITYAKHISRIFNERCVSCHREQEIAPFTLTSYEDILGWEDTILEVIADNRMPPWFADERHGTFSNDARLSEEEKTLIATWIDNGMPEGDPADLPEPPVFTTGWRIPEPDVVIEMDEAFNVPAEGIVDYQHFVIDPQWDEDKYIYAAEARPDNRSVVHHILVYIIPPGKNRPDLQKVLAGYAPGSDAMWLEDGVAIKVEAGSKLLFEMHYTPNGYEQTDKSYAGFCFMDEKDFTKELEGKAAINPRFKIPANDPHYVVTSRYFAVKDELLTDMTPHMHLRGKAFKFEANYPDGKKEVLLDVPNYDFNWQLSYMLDEPKFLPAGTMIECTAVFDNSEENLSNPNPNRDVTWGDQSFDEMMIGFFNVVKAD